MIPANLTPDMVRDHLEAMAQALVADARAYGMVLTIETRPLRPLAMGHHETVVEVRPAREMAKRS